MATAGFVTERVRGLTPPSHVRLQSPHALQRPTVQSDGKGHAASDMTLSSLVVGQEVPPRVGMKLTLLVRVEAACAHVPLHGDHALQNETRQFPLLQYGYGSKTLPELHVSHFDAVPPAQFERHEHVIAESHRPDEAAVEPNALHPQPSNTKTAMPAVPIVFAMVIAERALVP